MIFPKPAGIANKWKFFAQLSLFFAGCCDILQVVLLWKYQGAAQNGRRLAYTTRKGVERMRLTITLTLRKLMLQFIIKSRNRHPGR